MSDSMTLHVDVQNNGHPVDNVYTFFDLYQNRAVYQSANHTIASPDTLTLYRTIPKPAGNFPGQAKVAAKFSKQVVVLGNDGTDVSGPIITEISQSYPVGTTSARLLEERQKAVALVDRDDIMDKLVLRQAILISDAE